MLAIYLIFGVSIGAFVFANLIVAVIVANLELSVKEMREEEKLSNNPLEFHDRASLNKVDINPIYDLMCKHNLRLLSQRPLRIPNLRKVSQRRIQSYVTLIVALEQNLMEAEIIRLDMEKIVAVILSVVLQLDMYSQQQAVRNELKRSYEENVAKSKKFDGATNIIPPPTPSQQRAAQHSKSSVITSIPEPDNTTANLSFVQLVKNSKPVSANSKTMLPNAKSSDKVVKKK